MKRNRKNNTNKVVQSYLPKSVGINATMLNLGKLSIKYAGFVLNLTQIMQSFLCFLQGTGIPVIVYFKKTCFVFCFVFCFACMLPKLLACITSNYE